MDHFSTGKTTHAAAHSGAPHVQHGNWAPAPSPERGTTAHKARNRAIWILGGGAVFCVGLFIGMLVAAIIAIAVLLTRDSTVALEHKEGAQVAEKFIAALEEHDFEGAYDLVHKPWSFYSGPEDLEERFGDLFRYLGPRESLQMQASGTSVDIDGDELLVFVYLGTYEKEWPELTVRLYENTRGQWRIFSLSVLSEFWDLELPFEDEDDDGLMLTASR